MECGDVALTYAALLERAAGAALDVEPGVRVGIALTPGIEWVVSLWAVLLRGGVVVPVDLRLTADEQAARLAGADQVIREPVAMVEKGHYFPKIDFDAPLAVLHTSGTTAAPKAVELTWRNFQASALGSAVALGLDPGERWLCPMPLVHVGGLSIPLRSAIYATTVVLHERFETEAVLRALQESGMTLTSLVPTMLSRLLDAGLQNPPTLRYALLGGGPIAPLAARAGGAGRRAGGADLRDDRGLLTDRDRGVAVARHGGAHRAR